MSRSTLLQRVLVTMVVMMAAWPTTSRADDQPEPGKRAIFALVIGSNVSVDAELPALKYADDDAARYVDLFRLLGARTYLLTRPDGNTARLHAQATAEAQPPRLAELDQALVHAAADVAQARARHVETVFYFLYAGHGSVRNGEGYLGLEDTRLSGKDLASKVVAKIGADHFHFIIDACDSYLVAYPRGPGGARRPAEPLRDVHGLGDDPRVGLLLSSSSHRESHEWDGFQAGVFSHEVRSGLYGAADADGDGQVSYREISAFVARANAAIPNERFRPQVHARAPKDNDSLLAIGHRLGRRLEIDGQHAGHYVVEDARGVRLAETHTSPGTTVRLLRPAPSGREYVRRLDDDTEFVLPPEREIVALADLAPEQPRARTRGAAHDAFDLVFTLPFDENTVAGYEAHEPEVAPGADGIDSDTFGKPAAGADRAGDGNGGISTKKLVGYGALGLGAVAAGIGVTYGVLSIGESNGTSPGESQRDAANRNDRVARDRTASILGLGVGGALIATGVVVLLWPSAPTAVRDASASVTPAGGSLGFSGKF
ncbi:MAG: hypothetical protein JWO86_8759 [Myxococcaceae bacterium]|nr:hypothetical protein [Myxococcaceae bacterium]